MQDDGDHRRLDRGSSLDGEIDWDRGLWFDPVTETTEGRVGSQHRTNGGDQRVKGCGTVGSGLDDNLQFRTMLIVIAQRRQCDLRFARLAIAQDDQA